MSDLLKLIYETDVTTPLRKKKGRFCVDDITGVSLACASFFKHKKENLVIVAPNLYNAQKIYLNLLELLDNKAPLIFPAEELVRTEELASSKEYLSERLYSMGELMTGEPHILICHPTSLLRYLPSKEEFGERCFSLKVGDHIDIENLKRTLINSGYLKVNKLDQSFQFANRGDIFDVFPINSEMPIRIEFFDDEIETIRYFDIGTQLTIKDKNIDSINIYPSTDLVLTNQEKTDFCIDILNQIESDSDYYGARYDELRQRVEEDVENIKNNMFASRLYKYFSYAKKKTSTIIDYFSKTPTLVFSNYDQFKASAYQIYEESSNYMMELVKEAIIPARLQMYRNPEYIEEHYLNRVYGETYVSCEGEPKLVTRPIVYTGSSVSDIEPTIISYAKHSKNLVIALTSVQQINTIKDILTSNGLVYTQKSGFEFDEEKITIIEKNIDGGFEIPDLSFSLLTSKELFGQIYKNAKYSSKFKESTILRNYQDLKPGDYVVHEFRGIGQFIEVVTILTDGVNRDFLHIKYAGKDELFVPLSQFRLVRKYAGREGAIPKLSSLSGNEWKKTKEKIKARVKELADKLVKLYTERMKITGYAFPKDDEFQKNFEDEFPYELTPDQAKAVEEIKEDMESPHPMDRLLCGDVGFGKTEVAFRAIFKAISAGKQAALLCPTTLLARQHYEIAKSRFEHYGIKIAIFSRLVSKAEQNRYIKEIQQGKIHLAIGTHRLLSKDITFKDLGLLVVDEEQRFGVEQKEKIKELKTTIDVLTLSATPIPRTLQMSLMGLRGYSQINTAPSQRMPIQTYVIEYNKSIVKELIERELARNGQVFYLYNNISNIYFVAKTISESVKTANVAVAHGRMSKDEIEDTMLRYYNGDINVLVCTSIVENGIDIPNANLIIIENAELFGLSQLYQIKGRVGRGDRIAYAYLMYRPERLVDNEDARKRLKAIQEFTELGSGYKIAQRDLLIRGAGDILGAQQAGCIDSVGMDLYMKLLQDAINGRETEMEENKPNQMLKINAYIPSDYAIENDKIELYQMIEETKTIGEVNALKEKIRDVYGKLPTEVNDLFLKKKVDILLEAECFQKLNEYHDSVDLMLSDKFSQINGIGNKLFEELTPYLHIVKVNYVNHVVRLRIQKREYWVKELEKIMIIIVKLYFSKRKN